MIDVYYLFVSISQPVQENKLGSKNNKLDVKKTDFEVFEALDVDDTTPKKGKWNRVQQISIFLQYLK